MPSNKNDGKVNLHLRITAELNSRLETAASDRVVSANLLATKAIEYFLAHLAPVEKVLMTQEDNESGSDHKG